VVRSVRSGRLATHV